ncbi:hypothetical protein [Porphyromonas pogonae]|nr:hypothetical protein [Porphyromonas pogonae]
MISAKKDEQKKKAQKTTFNEFTSLWERYVQKVPAKKDILPEVENTESK